MQRWLRVLFQNLLLIFPILLQISEVRAVPAMGMGYEPKYPPDFTHFDYVAPDAEKAGEAVLYGLGTFDSLNPYLLKGISAAGLGSLVFESLLEKSLDEPFTMYGLIAEDFYLADDQLSVTFHINPAARFSNGKQVTAEDVKYSYDTLMSKEAHPQFRVYYGDIESAEVIDRLTVRFHFNNRNRELHMIVGEIPIFSREWIGEEPFDAVDDVPPISSGPYLIDSYERGRYIRYRRNPDYWAKDLPVRRGMYNFDSVVYKYYKDSTIALEAFKAGEFDYFFENYSKRWARSHTGPKYDTGEILKTELPHSNNAGMQGFIINTRRDKFKDVRVRRALSLAFDFEWSNSQLFYNQYERCDSYFSNSELASTGLPQGEELELLNEYRQQLPASVFEVEWLPPTTNTEVTLRDNLKKARDLLAEAGWTVRDGVLKNAQGEAFEIDVLLVQKGFDRIFAPYAANLKKLGIDMNYRTVDDSLYKRRQDSFEFDMVVASFPQSVSPGNELMNMFHSQAAEMQGSRNFPGISDPVVDALIEKIINAENRHDLVVTAHALDRVLLHGEYLVPNWYIDAHRIAYRDKFNRPETLPLYFEPMSWLLKTWWAKEKN
jgi:microcin C transport system substrate-binding protein